MSLQESGEMYLETIYVLSKKSDSVRSLDVAEQMGFSKPSVSRAMGILEKDGYIEFGIGNMINLTEKGQEKASDVYSRHQLLTKFIVKIAGIPEDQAEKNACRIEHVIDSDVVEGIKNWINKN